MFLDVPGQFARLRAPHWVYGRDDHPFTPNSSARQPDRPSFTVKALGDFSASLAELRAGEEMLVDGPHGEGIHDRIAARGRLLLAAGISITPALSVLRTSAEQDERRPLVLLYGSRRWAGVTFREELEDLGAPAAQPPGRACAVAPGRRHRVVPAAPRRPAGRNPGRGLRVTRVYGDDVPVIEGGGGPLDHVAARRCWVSNLR
jgi:ferredoxin-NADP reductase